MLARLTKAHDGGSIDGHRSWVTSPLHSNSVQKAYEMFITITVPHTAPDDAYARVERLARTVLPNDPNFENLEIRVQRGEDCGVDDPTDPLRASHLLLLVEDAVAAEGSFFGELRQR